ncbi:phage portal protein [Janibacter hoylei]|uniref:phage portal protein n=1 Tax=Janibacter hoylei TaxID=364298 RepID=UPI0021A8D8D3|nr:phage portal protein [Janibacter hoylei]MCT1618490.1 phage portal protein [Janibacter hoylei]MCT2294084.1 phage portal protein [Janibacter hoylei]
MTDTLTTLIQRLDEQEPRASLLDKYYAGTQPMAFLAPEAKAALGNRLTTMSSNLCRVAVTALSERLRVTGFTRGDAPDSALWDAWNRNDLDQQTGIAHREALIHGRSFALVWADVQGRSQVTIESARQVATLRDPATRDVVAAVKRWSTKDQHIATVFEPDRITRYVSANGTAGWKTTEALDNPFGVVPIVPLVNTDRLLDVDGRSEMSDLLPLVDALSKILADMMVASESTARPRRWATGLELEEDEDGNARNPIPESSKTMINENPDGKFGSLPGSDLAGYEAAVRLLTSQIMAVSSLPSHYLGVLSSQPPSADSLRAAEASLVAKAEARQATFGRSWEQVARLMVAADTGTDPESVDVAVKWADPGTRSEAQQADATVKLYQSGLIPASVALARLGYSDDEIAAIRTARRAESLDAVGTNIESLVNG